MKFISCFLVIFVFLGLPCFADAKEKRSLKNQSKFRETKSSETSQLDWMSYEKANEKAAETGKYVVLFFTGSDWCVWCTRMQKEIFATAIFDNFAKQHLCLVEVDFPHKNPLPEDLAGLNEGLRNRYQVHGFPTLVILNSKGDLVLREGFRHGGGAAYVNYLKDALGLNK